MFNNYKTIKKKNCTIITEWDKHIKIKTIKNIIIDIKNDEKVLQVARRPQLAS